MIIDLKKMAKIARTIAGEWANGEGPDLLPDSYSFCAMGQLVARYRDETSTQFLLHTEGMVARSIDQLLTVTGEGDVSRDSSWDLYSRDPYDCMVSAAIHSVNHGPGKPHDQWQSEMRQAAVFPLLAWADAADKIKQIEVY